MQKFNIATLEPTIHVILGVILTFICLCSLEEEDFKKIGKALCISSVLVSSVGILQILGFDIFGKLVYYKEDNKFIAFFDHPNVIGNYLTLSVPLFLYFNKLKYYLGLVIVLVGLLLSHCVGAILASILGISLFIYIALRNRKRLVILWTILLSLGLAYICFPISKLYHFFKLSSGMDGRLDTWHKAIVHIKDNPIFGQGLGIFKTWNVRTSTISELYWYNPHNDWLDIICQIGILGLVLLVLVIFNSLRRFNYKVENKLGIAYLCVMFEYMFIMIGSFPSNIAPIILTGLISFWAVEII